MKLPLNDDGTIDYWAYNKLYPMTSSNPQDYIDFLKAIYEHGYVEGFNGCETSLVPRAIHDTLDQCAEIAFQHGVPDQGSSFDPVVAQIVKAIRKLGEKK